MESSPLIKAHDHARAASTATQAHEATTAINEHACAAGEFAKAAQNTSSIEALRTLKLLEQHHQRLAELLRSSIDPPSQSSQDDVDEKQTHSKTAASSDAQSKLEVPSGSSSSKNSAQVPSLPRRRYPPRDLTSSIASNLASARGIRSKYRGQPASPSVSVDQAPGSMESLPRRDSHRTKMQNMLDQPAKPARAGPDPAHRRAESRTHDVGQDKKGNEASPNTADDGYSRFYNTFGSLINRLSAPLAIAGLPLPLITEESSEQPALPESPATKKNKLRPPPPITGEPDLSKIYSKATLRAISRDGHPHPANESFYWVQPTGHTMSYASVLSFAEKEKRRNEASVHGDTAEVIDDEDDDFVDARETPAPLSPIAKRRIGRGRTERDLNNTIEELCLENKSLKDMLDKLSKRLQTFEASAQNSSLALAESMRLMRPGSPLSSGSGKMPGDDALRKTNTELDEKLATALKRVEVLEKDNEKMIRTLAKYREKWEKLKESAKARRGGQTPGDVGTDDPGPG